MELSDNVDLGNLLVKQKNRIIRLINDNMLQAAQAALDTVRELWEACEYAYKYRELDARIVVALAWLRDSNKSA